jgi:hypothetical protein
MKWVKPWRALRKCGYRRLKEPIRKPTKTNPFVVYGKGGHEFIVYPDGDCQLIFNPMCGKTYDSYYYSLHEKTRVAIVTSIQKKSASVKLVSPKKAMKHLLGRATLSDDNESDLFYLIFGGQKHATTNL